MCEEPQLGLLGPRPHGIAVDREGGGVCFGSLVGVKFLIFLKVQLFEYLKHNFIYF